MTFAGLVSRRGGSNFFGALGGIAALLLIAQPTVVIGDSTGVDALKQERILRIQSLLLSQDESMLMAGDLARGILLESERNFLDPVLILAIIHVESRFDHNAISPRGAQGLMQVTPVVVTALLQEGRISAPATRNLKDPLVNVRLGVTYLAYLHEMFGDLTLALSAYNWGPTRIRKKLAAKETIPMEYAGKVLTVHRSLEHQLAQMAPSYRAIDRPA
jgi:soluble lytic murein transglycosylase